MTRIVSDIAPIFRTCATKDETIIRQAFDAGIASPFDQTASGITLLHVAAASYRYDIYKLLQDCGVEYSLCEHPKYGKLVPVELTQDFTILADGMYQTVQQWLNISNKESVIVHPEANYQSVVGIWNSSIETEESMTDEQIMTMLQGPLRLPRPRKYAASNVDGGAQEAGDTPVSRCSSSLLLFCYYFLFHQDPYGVGISEALLKSRSWKNSIRVPLYEYLSQYWHGDKWLEMLSNCHDLDFHKLAQRQQEKFQGFSYSKFWDNKRGKWVRKKTALFQFGEDGEKAPCIWIGPLDQCEVVFEFDSQECEDCSLAEDKALENLVPEATPRILSVVWPCLLIGAVLAFVTLFCTLYL
ncbi:hypothetical protein BDZ45DRAFT_190045 [Acephala macrosclerotiorum]|nr:hypothetical protein BDZ45DRAFT_190045 [Acephala macrosclerotiorum]